MSDRIRILCISPSFAPLADSEAFCGTKMVKALIDFGVDVRVICTGNINGSAFPLDRSSLWQSTRSVATDVPVPAAKERFRCLRTTLRYQSLYARWLDDVIQLAKRLHREREFQLVYSRSWPMVAHAAGYWCSRLLGLPWVANTNDPWDVCYFPGVQRTELADRDRFFASLWLQRTFRCGRLLMFPSERLANFHFGLAGRKAAAVIIPHIGYSHKSEDSGNGLAGGRPLFNLVHTGKLGTSEVSRRSARGLFAGLAGFLATAPDARPVVRLLLAGSGDGETQSLVEEYGLREQVVHVGLVSYEESLGYIAKASVCVLVEAQMEEGMFLPSKLADYIAARKPILALSPRTGVAADMAAAGELQRAEPDDPTAIGAAIAGLYADFQRGSLHSSVPGEAFSKQFDPQVVAGRFVAAVDGILRTSGRRLNRVGFAVGSGEQLNRI